MALSGRDIFSMLIFLVHAIAAIVLMFVVSNKDSFPAPTDVHYMETFVTPLAGSRALHRVTSYLGIFGGVISSPDVITTSVKGAWPITMDESERSSTDAFTIAAITGESAQYGAVPYSGGIVLVPNIKRCSDRYPNIANHTLNRPNRLQACTLTGQIQTIKIESDPWHTLVLGSSISVPYSMLIFEWISASFALHYIGFQNMNRLNKRFVRFVILCVSVAWNFTLVIMSMVLSSESRWDIPTNNLVVGVACLLFTMTVQTFHLKEIVIYYVTTRAGSQRNATTPSTANDTITPKTSLRYIEYSITAPILMVGVCSTTILGVQLWSLQSAYACILVTNLLGITAHQCAMLLYKESQQKSESTHAQENFLWATILFLVSSWTVFFGAWLIYFDSTLRFWSVYPAAISAVVLILPSAFASFGFVATSYYGWLLFKCYTNVPNDKSFQQKTAWLEMSFDILSLSVKVIVAAVVTFSDQFGPGSGIEF